MAESTVPPNNRRARADGASGSGGNQEEEPFEVITGTCNWTLFRSLPTFDIRNGDPSSITSVLIRATIGESFHWVPIQGLDVADAPYAIDGFIRSHMAHLHLHKPLNYTDDQVRKVAIALGTIRAISTGFYRLGINDLIPGETAQPYLRARKGTGNVIEYAVNGTPSAEVRSILTENLVLSGEEMAVVCQLVKCAAGIIPMQGYSLIMTNHHYLSSGDTQARRVYSVVEKAYWRSTDVGSWFTNDLEKVQDAVWHKAAHPVSMNIKETTAKDPEIVSKLVNAGAGACASRLPAKETELRAANSYITLFATVSPMFKMCGGDIDMSVFTGVVNAVSVMPSQENVPADTSGIPEAYKNLVHDRSSGLAVVGTLVRQNADSAALCYGFYVALTDTSSTLGGGTAAGQDTLKSSFSLAKLRNQSHASFVAGTEMFRDYQAVRNKRRNDGIFRAPSLEIS